MLTDNVYKQYNQMKIYCTQNKHCQYKKRFLQAKFVEKGSD